MTLGRSYVVSAPTQPAAEAAARRATEEEEPARVYGEVLYVEEIEPGRWEVVLRVVDEPDPDDVEVAPNADLARRVDAALRVARARTIPGQSGPFVARMMPGETPYTAAEYAAVQRLVREAAEGDPGEQGEIEQGWPR